MVLCNRQCSADMLCSVVVVVWLCYVVLSCHLLYVLGGVDVSLVSGTKVVLCQTFVNGVVICCSGEVPRLCRVLSLWLWLCHLL